MSDELTSCTVDGNAIPVVADGDPVAPLGRIVAELGLGDEGFGRIADVTLTGDGSVIVADGQTQEAIVFSLEGDPLGTFSRRGEGPGEFESLSRVVTGPDGAVHLAQPGRAAEFSGRSVPQHVETSALSTVTTAEGVEYFAPELVAVLRGGSDVFLAVRPAGESDPPPDFGIAEVEHTSLRGLLVPSAGGWRELSQLPGTQHFVLIEGRRILFDRGNPFSAASSFSASDSSVLLSPGSDFSVRELDPSGTTIRSWTVCGLSPRQLTDAEIARFIDAELTNANDAFATAVRSMFESMDFPEAHPAVQGLVFDGSQQIWIRLEGLDQGGAEVWGAFTTDGDWLGRFQAPPELEIRDVREGTAVGVRTDAFGVQTAVIVRLEL